MTWLERLKSKTYIWSSVTAALEFAKMAFPGNAKVLAAIQVVSGLLAILGLREAVANSAKN